MCVIVHEDYIYTDCWRFIREGGGLYIRMHHHSQVDTLLGLGEKSYLSHHLCTYEKKACFLFDNNMILIQRSSASLFIQPQKLVEYFPNKHNILVHGDIRGIIWCTRNDFIPDDWYSLIKKLLNLSARGYARVKCDRFTFELLPMKFHVSLKIFFWSFPHSTSFVEQKRFFFSNNNVLILFSTDFLVHFKVHREIILIPSSLRLPPTYLTWYNLINVTRYQCNNYCIR